MAEFYAIKNKHDFTFLKSSENEVNSFICTKCGEQANSISLYDMERTECSALTNYLSITKKI